jgi:plastocyanin
MKMDSKNISLAAAAVVIVAGYFWWSSQSMQPADVTTPVVSDTEETSAKAAAPVAKPAAPKPANPSMTADGTYVVYYGSSGFSPRLLEIPLGKSVRFVNNSGKAMRISSSDNTNSPIYAALNQSKTVGQGGIYEYTFIYKGSYSYNNINNPIDQGIVVVK